MPGLGLWITISALSTYAMCSLFQRLRRLYQGYAIDLGQRPTLQFHIDLICFVACGYARNAWLDACERESEERTIAWDIVD